MEEKKKFPVIYLLAILYALSAYLGPVAFLIMSDADAADKVTSWLFWLPVILGVVNLIVVLAAKSKIERKQLLVCSMIIKYALVPFYLVGGLLIVLCLLLMVTPIVFMVFVGPVMALILGIYGWLILLAAAPFSVAYIVWSYKGGFHSKALLVISAIMQFFFTMDVIFITVLAIRERKYK